MDKPKNSATKDTTPERSNSNMVDLDPNDTSPASSSRKRPVGRDVAKAAKKKASSVSQEYVSKMHDLSIQKIELFKEIEDERKIRLDEIVSLEKVKVEEAREHRRTMIELERERLALDKQHLNIEAEKKRRKRMSAFWLSTLINDNPFNACTIKLCRRISLRS
ncbi:hypothetical protein GUJ93_ZPchr0006g45573 [Zizania palustris]|uniref:No apical meristem-associated C-terminal domain-containing protein n=1 Tax=Zizania palustris TaxID=103762 RepID=A0A8J5VQ63_ZIZPA|nr:hypothetical protein GUJ93_ZPchr0006g45573 [Zizania palustris]